MNENEISSLIQGENGVYKVLLSKNIVTELDDYTSYSKKCNKKPKKHYLRIYFQLWNQYQKLRIIELYIIKGLLN